MASKTVKKTQKKATTKATTSDNNNSTTNKPLLSVIVPTYNEKGNMKPLINGLTDTLDEHKIPFEIIVMDDNSPDGTAAEVESLHNPRARAVVRTTNRGLSPAVIQGYSEAKGDIYLVMDADLSHPISAVPEIYKRITENGADVVVGSRHTAGGGIEDWPFVRRVISFGAALMARPLTPCTDPMAGFFAIKPSVIRNVKLNAAGFKILLEVLVKGNYSNLQEVPITFRDREIGESKLTSGVMINYITHLIQLYLYPGSAPLLKFLFVGGLGAIFDIIVFSVLIAYLGKENALWAQIPAFFVSFLWGYFVNKSWTFYNPHKPKPKAGEARMQFVKAFVVALVGLGIRMGLFKVIRDATGVNEAPWLQVIQLTVIMIVSIINFIGSKLWAYK